MNKHKKIIIAISVITAIILYFLSEILFNPLILWTALPLYISYAFINSATETLSVKKLFATYGFMIVSTTLSLLYHLAWYLDWKGTKTGDSSSEIIFVIFPIYAVLLGFVGYFIGSAIGSLYGKKNKQSSADVPAKNSEVIKHVI